MGLEAEPGLSLSRASQGRFAYGSSDVAGKTGLQVAALYATGWADDPFTEFQGDPMLTGGDNPKGLKYPRANFPGYGHGYARIPGNKLSDNVVRPYPLQAHVACDTSGIQ